MSGTPAGWYAAPHANNELRYWDGSRWLESPPPVDGPQPSPSPSMGDGSNATSVATATYTQAPSAPAYPGSVPAGTRGLALAALIVGIGAFVIGWIPWLGLLLGIAAVALSVVALIKHQSKVMSLFGLVLGGLAMLTGLVMTIGFMAVVNAPSTPVAAASPAVEAEQSPVAKEPESPAEEPVAEDPAPPQPAAEPAAPTADGSAERPYPQPYVAVGLLGGEKYSLTGRLVDANAGGLVSEWNQFNSPAPSGFKYVVVELTMTGIDPDGVEPSLAEWDLSLATVEGNQYSSESVVFGEGMPQMWEGPTLYPGNSFTGYTAYVVPEAAQSFMLHDNGNYISF